MKRDDLYRPGSRLRTGILAALVIVMAALLVSIKLLHLSAHPVEGWRHFEPFSTAPTPLDRRISQRFLAGSVTSEVPFDILFGYFLHGFVASASPDFAAIHYRGLPSDQGWRISGLQGFARTAPLFAAWIHSGRNRQMADPASGKTVDLVAILKSGVLAGTDPSAAAYWGTTGDGGQRIVEAADIARLLWLTRETIWNGLTETQKQRIADWLRQVEHAPIATRGDRLLSAVLVDSFLAGIGYGRDAREANYFEFKKNYLQDGWFRDGPAGKVDYDNAWGVSYELFWIHLLNPTLDAAFIENTLTSSAALTAHLISPEGIPIMGRSLCYRTAVPSAVIAGSFIAPTMIAPGLARRALEVTWRYFVAHGILRDGSLTMGYFGTDPRLVDWYSGPGSCHWGLRSLTLAFLTGPNDRFWTALSAPLPVEVGDYRIALKRLGWVVTGRKATGDITVTIRANRDLVIEPISYSVLKRWTELLSRRPQRPRNLALKYGLRRYSAIDPLGGALSEGSGASGDLLPQR